MDALPIEETLRMSDGQQLEELLRDESEMLLDSVDPLLQTFDAFLNLPVGELNERAGFPELLIQIGPIVDMTPVEMHLEPFGNQLEFVSKPFSQDTSVPFGIDDFSPKSVSSGADNLLNLRQ
jgi:hypothetical protein